MDDFGGMGWPRCAQCNKPADSVTSERTYDRVVVRVYCHGATQEAILPDADMLLALPRGIRFKDVFAPIEGDLMQILPLKEPDHAFEPCEEDGVVIGCAHIDAASQQCSVPAALHPGRPLRLPQIPSPVIVFTCSASATEARNAAAYSLMPDPTHNGGRLCKGCKKNVYFGKGKVCSSCRAPKPNYKKKGFVRGRGSGVRT